jgi:spore coat polysaccharide biosynthesis protein SpsF
MGSTRLPGKILRTIGHTTLLGHIVRRLEGLRHPATRAIATTTLAEDDVVAAFCAANDIHCFRGSESNVLGRFYECSRFLSLDHVVRLTGDNPFIDIDELNRLIDLHLNARNDFSSSLEALPVGVGAEIFTAHALMRSLERATLPHHFEHVDEYLLENPGLFKTGALQVPTSKQRPDISLTVDTPGDYEKACFVAQIAGSSQFTTEEAIQACLLYASKHPTSGGWATSTAGST